MKKHSIEKIIVFLTFSFLSILLSGCNLGSLSESTTKVAEFSYGERIVIPTIDDRDLVYLIDRPLADVKVPILLSVDGSSCIGQQRPRVKNTYKPDQNSPRLFARVLVEKPGVEHTAAYPSECSDEFLKYYTIEQRVIDHLRTLQHLKTTANWWNGELYVWGWSDGGDVAAQITAYYPNVTRAVLGAMGGGYTMAEHFKDFWVCSEERAGDQREDCIKAMDAQFQEMFDNPTWTKTWSGPDNSWKVWPSRLNSRLSNILQDNTTPILIVQGAEDFDATPVASARKLVADLKGVQNSNYTYWEVPEMEHGWSKLPKDQGDAFEAAMLNWLLGVDVGVGGPPNFGKTD